MGGTDFSQSNLFQVSISDLYDGMVVQEDIYDADASTLIVQRGVKLTPSDRARILSLNSDRETIHVTGATYSNLMEHKPNFEPVQLSKLVEETGYTAAKDETFTLLDEIVHTRAVRQEALLEVSNELSNRLEVTSPSVILSLINALAPVDEYLQRHCVNVGLLNGLIAQWMGLKKNEVDKLVLIGLLHDCGKALIPVQVLNAPRKLTVVEFEVIKMHPVFSYDLLKDFPDPVRQGARCHHEKINGNGYPDRYTLNDIPWEARITAISDIYDAMVSQRSYKNAGSPFSTMGMLRKLIDSDVDASFVDVFVRLMPKELMGKPVLMSDGSIGVLRAFDPEDIEHPTIELYGRIVKSSESLYCTSMYTDADAGEQKE